MQLDAYLAVGIAGSTIGVCSLWSKTYKWAAHRMEKRAAERRELLSAMTGLNEAISSLRNPTETEAQANQLLEGTIKACEAIAMATSELRDEVVAFRKLLSNPPQAEYPADALQTPTEEDATIAASRYENILRGRTPEEADQIARDIEEKKTMLSAISLGPVEG